MFNFINKINPRFGPAIIVIAVILLLSGGFFYFFNLNNKNNIDIRQFAGGVNKIDNSLIYVSGNFISSEHPELGKIGSNVTVGVNTATKFIRILVHLPPMEELKKSRGYFNGKDLKRDEGPSDLETFKHDFASAYYGVNIFAGSNSNIYGKTSFVATEVKYEIAQ